MPRAGARDRRARTSPRTPARRPGARQPIWQSSRAPLERLRHRLGEPLLADQLQARERVLLEAVGGAVQGAPVPRTRSTPQLRMKVWTRMLRRAARPGVGNAASMTSLSTGGRAAGCEAASGRSRTASGPGRPGERGADGQRGHRRRRPDRAPAAPDPAPAQPGPPLGQVAPGMGGRRRAAVASSTSSRNRSGVIVIGAPTSLISSWSADSAREVWLLTVPSAMPRSRGGLGDGQPEPVPQHDGLALHLGQPLQGGDQVLAAAHVGAPRPRGRGPRARCARGATAGGTRRSWSARPCAGRRRPGWRPGCTRGQATYSLASAVCTTSSAACQSPQRL